MRTALMIVLLAVALASWRAEAQTLENPFTVTSLDDPGFSSPDPALVGCRETATAFPELKPRSVVSPTTEASVTSVLLSPMESCLPTSRSILQRAVVVPYSTARLTLLFEFPAVPGCTAFYPSLELIVRINSVPLVNASSVIAADWRTTLTRQNSAGTQLEPFDFYAPTAGRWFFLVRPVGLASSSCPSFRSPSCLGGAQLNFIAQLDALSYQSDGSSLAHMNPFHMSPNLNNSYACFSNGGPLFVPAGSSISSTSSASPLTCANNIRVLSKTTPGVQSWSPIQFVATSYSRRSSIYVAPQYSFVVAAGVKWIEIDHTTVCALGCHVRVGALAVNPENSGLLMNISSSVFSIPASASATVKLLAPPAGRYYLTGSNSISGSLNVTSGPTCAARQTGLSTSDAMCETNATELSLGIPSSWMSLTVPQLFHVTVPCGALALDLAIQVTGDVRIVTRAHTVPSGSQYMGGSTEPILGSSTVVTLTAAQAANYTIKAPVAGDWFVLLWNAPAPSPPSSLGVNITASVSQVCPRMCSGRGQCSLHSGLCKCAAVTDLSGQSGEGAYPDCYSDRCAALASCGACAADHQCAWCLSAAACVRSSEAGTQCVSSVSESVCPSAFTATARVPAVARADITSPSLRTFTRSSSVTCNGRFWLYGGKLPSSDPSYYTHNFSSTIGSSFCDLWVLNLDTLKWTDLSGSLGSHASAVANEFECRSMPMLLCDDADVSNMRLVLYGGHERATGVMMRSMIAIPIFAGQAALSAAGWELVPGGSCDPYSMSTPTCHAPSVTGFGFQTVAVPSGIIAGSSGGFLVAGRNAADQCADAIGNECHRVFVFSYASDSWTEPIAFDSWLDSLGSFKQTLEGLFGATLNGRYSVNMEPVLLFAPPSSLVTLGVSSWAGVTATALKADLISGEVELLPFTLPSLRVQSMVTPLDPYNGSASNIWLVAGGFPFRLSSEPTPNVDTAVARPPPVVVFDRSACAFSLVHAPQQPVDSSVSAGHALGSITVTSDGLSLLSLFGQTSSSSTNHTSAAAQLPAWTFERAGAGVQDPRAYGHWVYAPALGRAYGWGGVDELTMTLDVTSSNGNFGQPMNWRNIRAEGTFLGVSASTSLAQVAVFDPATETFTRESLAPLSVRPSARALAALATGTLAGQTDGTVFLYGGLTVATLTAANDWWRYRPAASRGAADGLWEPFTPTVAVASAMPEAMSRPCLFAHGAYLYLLGGEVGTASTATVHKMYRMHQTTLVLESMGDGLPAAARLFCAVVPSGVGTGAAAPVDEVSVLVELSLTVAQALWPRTTTTYVGVPYDSSWSTDNQQVVCACRFVLPPGDGTGTDTSTLAAALLPATFCQHMTLSVTAIAAVREIVSVFVSNNEGHAVAFDSGAMFQYAHGHDTGLVMAASSSPLATTVGAAALAMPSPRVDSRNVVFVLGGLSLERDAPPKDWRVRQVVHGSSFAIVPKLRVRAWDSDIVKTGGRATAVETGLTGAALAVRSRERIVSPMSQVLALSAGAPVTNNNSQISVQMTQHEPAVVEALFEVWTTFSLLNREFVSQYVPTDEPVVFTPCARGQRSSSATLPCEPCPVGTMGMGNETCAPCETPTVSLVAGSVQCVPCAAGFQRLSTSSCVACQPGTFSSEAGAAVCTSCPDGSYANVSEARECVSCANGLVSTAATAVATTIKSGASSREQCICDEGYFGQPALGAECIACAAEGVVCARGATLPVPLPGYWFDPSNPTRVLKCAVPAACLGGALSLCLKGYTGEACSVCSSGYYPLSATCNKCPDNSTIPLVVAGILLLILALVLVRVARKAGNSRGAFGSVTIAINFIQVTAVFGLLKVGFPPEIAYFFRIFSILNLNLDLAAPECAVSVSYETKWAIQMLMPVMFAVVFTLEFLLTHAHAAIFRRAPARVHAFQVRGRHLFSPKTPSQLTDVLNNCLHAFWLFLSLAYIFVTSKSLEIFSCSRQTDGTYYLNAYPPLKCFTSSWQRLVLPAVVGLVVYGLGIPIAFMVILFHNYRRALRSVHQAGATRFSLFRSRYGFLIARYEPPYYFWELFAIARKVLIVTALTFFNDLLIMQALMSMTTMFLALIAQVYARPFRSTTDDRLETLLLSTDYVLLLIGLLFHSGKLDNSSVLFLTVIGVSMLALSLLSIVVYMALELRLMLRARKYRRVADNPENGELIKYAEFLMQDRGVYSLMDWLMTGPPQDYIDALTEVLDEVLRTASAERLELGLQANIWLNDTPAVMVAFARKGSEASNAKLAEFRALILEHAFHKNAGQSLRGHAVAPARPPSSDEQELARP